MKKLILFVVLLTGCAHDSVMIVRDSIAEKPKFESQVVVYNKTLEPLSKIILEKARQRFPKCIVLICHGDTIDNVWRAFPDNEYIMSQVTSQGLALSILELCPKDFQIILWIENPEGTRINLPKQFWYSLKKDLKIEDFINSQDKEIDHVE